MNHYSETDNDLNSGAIFDWKVLRNLRRQFTSKLKVIGILKHKKRFHGEPIPDDIKGTSAGILAIAHQVAAMNDNLDNEDKQLDHLLRLVQHMDTRVSSLETMLQDEV